MGILDRILGREPEEGPTGAPAYGQGTGPDDGRVPATQRTPDERAIERYRYLLATAPPEAVEQTHAEAFARLTPEQRRQVLQQLAEHVPAAERQGDDPAGLARMATRTEMRRPGTLERTFGGVPGGAGGVRGGAGGGPGFGAMLGGSMLGTVAGVVVGTAIANTLFGPAFGDLGSDQFAGAADTGGDAGADAGPDTGSDHGGDAGGGAGADGGGDVGGDFGGDFGGGDFGGDFGGGDFGGF
jgi:hypothetical protein